MVFFILYQKQWHEIKILKEVQLNKNNKIIILTGPCGVGKTSIAKIVSEKIEVELIDGDSIKENLFPDVDYITEFPEKLKIVKETILELSKKHFSKNKPVLIDYVIVGRDYISQFQNLFKENLIFKVILPNRIVTYQRDQNRECWTSGRKMIDELYDKYINLIDVIGQENYIDNEGETAEETALKILQSITSYPTNSTVCK